MKKQTARKAHIASVISRWLLVVVLGVYLAASALMYAIQYTDEDREYREFLTDSISLTLKDLRVNLDREVYEQASLYIDGLSARILANPGMLANPDTQMETVESSFEIWVDRLSVSEFDLVDRSGEIVLSTDRENIGYNLRNHPALEGMLQLFDVNTDENTGTDTNADIDTDAEAVIPSHCDGATINNPSIARYSAAVIPGTDMLLLCGITRDDIDEILLAFASTSWENTRVGEDGFYFTATSDLVIRAVSGNRFIGKTLPELGIDVRADEEYSAMVTKLRVNGKPSYVGIDNTIGYFYGIVDPVSEAMEGLFTSLFSTLALMTALFVVLYFVLVRLIKLVVINKIEAVNKSLSAITSGNLEEKVNVRDTLEFNSLSDDINATVDRLKRLIAEEAARIDAELSYAKQIQSSALPSVFPPFPQCPQFDLYARMDTAKDVGGDFYDFYLLDGDRLAFLIADVSGKGIPAALFMMRSKTMIKNLAEENRPVNEILTLANQRLCEGNDAGMFVTVWMCILNYKTGEAEYANAGHNQPVLRRKDGTFEYLTTRPGFVLAGLKKVKYRKNALTFAPGDEIYLYTDGVTEANNADEAMFGEERLAASLNSVPSGNARTLCDKVKADVDGFVGNAPQFDDITMVCLRYLGQAPEGDA